MAYEFFISPLFKIILDYIQETAFSDVTREAYWCIWNTIECSAVETRIEIIKKYDLCSIIAKMIRESKDNTRINKITLICADKLLSTHEFFPKDSDDNPRVAFEIAGGVDICETLQQAPNVEIYSLCQKLLKQYYPDGEDIVVEQEMSEDEKLQF